MSQLQKKCLVASSGMHLFLLALLVVGSAFLPSPTPKPPPPVNEMQLISILPAPAVLVDENISGGGNPKATAPPAAEPERKPPEPLPLPLPPKQVTPRVEPLPEVKPKPPVKHPEPEPEPEPVRVQPKPPKKESDSLEVSAKPQPKKKLKVDLTVVTRNPAPTGTRNSKKKPQPVPADRGDDAPNPSRVFGETLTRLRGNLSGTTRVDMPGPGGGGVSYGPYKQDVMRRFYDAWIVPTDSASDKAQVKTAIVISRDGRVISARITDPCGDRAVDASVRRALERVTSVAPFPEGAKDSQRTYYFIFDLEAKRGSG